MWWSRGAKWSRGKVAARGMPPALLVVALLALGAVVLLLRPGQSARLPGPEHLSGSLPYATLLCQFSDSAPPAAGNLEPPSYYDRLMVGGVGSVDDLWRQVSYGAINLQGSKAFGWFQMAKPQSAYEDAQSGRVDLDGLARDCTAAAKSAGGQALRFGDYAGINLVFSACVDRPRGGAIDLTVDGRSRGYRVTWLCPGYASSQQIVAHEIGHSFGLTHSEDNQGSEYGNNWDLMSNAAVCASTTDLGTTGQQPIAYDKDVLGWIAPSDKYSVRQSGVETIQLDYLEKARSASAGFLLAEIPLPGGRFYTVEARSRTGYDNGLPSAGVLIHEIDPRRANRARLVTGESTASAASLLGSRGGWGAGSVYIDRENNVAVSVDRQLGAGFVVTLYTGALPWPEAPSLMPVSGDSAALLQWRPVAGTQQYEIQVTRVTAGDVGSREQEWGVTFVSDKPSLKADLPAGRYLWQVRALPAGHWSPEEVVVAGRSPTWQRPEQIAQFDSRLTVAPMVNAQANGEVYVAWAEHDRRSPVSVARAAWQGDTWAVHDVFHLPASAQPGLALSFTSTGELQPSWPAESVDGAYATSTPSVALDAGGRAHTIWAGAGRGVPGIFSAIVDPRAPSAGPSLAASPIPVDGDATAAAKYAPSIALDGEGNAQAIWIDTRDGLSAVYSAYQWPTGEWSRGQRLSGSEEVAQGRPAIAVSSSGNAYAAWQSGVDCGGPVPLAQITFAEQPAGRRWQSPHTLAFPNANSRVFDPVVAVNDAGAVFVAWSEAQNRDYSVYSIYRSPEGQWEAPRLVANGHYDSGDISLSLAVNPGGDAYLTWPETQAGRTTVRFAATR